MAKRMSRAARAADAAGKWTSIAERLREATTAKEATDAVSDLDTSEFESLKEEIENWRDNMSSANMEHLPKYEEVEEAADSLDNIDVSNVEGRTYEGADYDADSAEEAPEWRDQAEEDADELENAASELEQVNFPGMF